MCYIKKIYSTFYLSANHLVNNYCLFLQLLEIYNVNKRLRTVLEHFVIE